MRRWIAGSLTAGFFSTGIAWADHTATDEAPKKPAPWSGKSWTPRPASEAPADFPPPKDAPSEIQTVVDAPRPVIAKPVVRTMTVQPPAPTIAPAPPPSPLPTLTTDAPATTTATGSNYFDWPAPAGRNNGRIYGSAEYLALWMRSGPTPPLVQVISPESAMFAIQTGELPPNATIDVFPDGGTDPGTFSGARGVLGLWLDSCPTWGVEVGYTQIFRQSDQFEAVSGGIPVLGRNFFDVAAQRNAFLRYTNPNGSQTGYIRVDAPTQAVGGEANVRYHGLAILADRTEYIAGVRYFNLKEFVSIDSGSQFRDAMGAVTTSYDSTETFAARNEFYGGQIGMDSHFYYGSWTLDVGSKLALGSISQRVGIEGSTTVTRPGQPTEFYPNQSLLYVQPTNAGSYSRNEFAVMPEVSIRLGYQLTDRIRATIGYEFIGISSVVRAGSAIDVNVNPNNTQFIGTNRPSNAPNPVFGFNGTEWWAQGISAGLAMNY